MVVIPSQMGRLNKRALLARLQRLGRASRADLAKSLGLSQPTAGKIADDLLELGVLEETDGPATDGAPERARLGRPGRLLRLNRSTPRFLAIQLGVKATNLATLPVGAQAEDVWAHEIETARSAPAWVRSLRQVAAKMNAKGVWGVLVSVPGIVDEQAGRVVFSPNLHWTESVDLPGLIGEVWDLPVVLVQEERALALGHQYVEPETEDFLLVDFGEGVGGAVIVDSRLYANPLPISGELGHTPVLGNARPCGCGAVGCVETLISTRGLLESFRAHRRLPTATWKTLLDGIRENGVEAWLAAALDATAVVIAGALNVLGLRRVVVTGSLAEMPPPALDYLRQAILQGAMWARFGDVHIVGAPRHRTAGLVAVGLDRLVLPMTEQRPLPLAPASPLVRHHRMTIAHA
jgi:predicted NBD/HSP70 family sugar kinase